MCFWTNKRKGKKKMETKKTLRKRRKKHYKLDGAKGKRRNFFWKRYGLGKEKVAGKEKK